MTNNTNDTDDPLDGAAIGETATITETKTVHAIDIAPREFWGTDRFSDTHVSDVNVVDPEHEGDMPEIEITFEGEVTKRLPPNWDYHKSPVTAEEKRVHRRNKWLKRIGRAASVAIPVGVSGWIAMQVMDQFAGVTVNGKPMDPAITPLSMLPFAVIVLLLVLIMQWAVEGGLPRQTR